MVSKPYTFTPDTTIDPDQVNQNFDVLVDELNTNVVKPDGTVAFTAVPTGPASDPSTDNQLARKKYVDDTVGALEGKIVAGKASQSLSNQSSLSGQIAVEGVTSAWTVVLSVSSTLGLIVNLESLSGGYIVYRVRTRDGAAASGSYTVNAICFNGA